MWDSLQFLFKPRRANTPRLAASRSVRLILESPPTPPGCSFAHTVHRSALYSLRILNSQLIWLRDEIRCYRIYCPLRLRCEKRSANFRLGISWHPWGWQNHHHHQKKIHSSFCSFWEPPCWNCPSIIVFPSFLGNKWRSWLIIVLPRMLC